MVMKWLSKRFWLAVDWALLLIAIMCSLPILVAVARAVARAMNDQP